ncbi:eukaryotic translation initiation factor 3 subunit B-like [Syngnathus typhle]|uniref:eukaryotic translation initiation factor 3 subunit B-like n=1 Tax=Syngnathus typhle TaxID=161592 RepID=UPI002A6A2A38|nr:eukaryotic translation initiation factor 3 subunit B-like [Syngnathus typhle]
MLRWTETYVRWSPKGTYLATFHQRPCGAVRSSSRKHSLCRFQSIGLLDKKSLKISGIKDFSWSPGDNILAFWVPEDKDIPARVTLMQLPSRQEIRVRNLFNVVDCKLYWQRNGDYLCVKVDRTPKGTRSERERNKPYMGLLFSQSVNQSDTIFV